MILLDLLRLLVANVIHIFRDIVNAVVNANPERERTLQQHRTVVRQYSHLELAHVLGSGIDARDEFMTGQAVLEILGVHRVAFRLLTL